MTHDKFCEGNGLGCGEYFCDEPCICDLLAKARADEREKAAQRIDAMDNWFVCEKNHDHVRIEEVIAAARGECNEECEHDWWQVWSYLPVTCRLCGAARGGEQA